MKVENKKVVNIHYSATDIDGKVVDSNEGFAPLEYLHGYDNILASLEAALDGLTAGQETQVMLSPADAYGEYDASKLMEVTRNNFPDENELSEGDIVESEDGNNLTVIGINEQTVALNGNHPLAGKTLNFWIKVVSIREATSDELQYRHPLPEQIESCGSGCCC